MPSVKLTVLESRCRCGYVKEGDTFVVDDLCPPICHELWNSLYPMLYALQNGAVLEYGEKSAKMFDLRCPDEGCVLIHGEVVSQEQKEPAQRETEPFSIVLPLE